jgi:GNAT superfamily N-acetyltransferase
MKRLFVRKAFRGFGLGRQLAEAMLDIARQAGYDHVLLDTLDDMESPARCMWTWASSPSNPTITTRFQARTTSRPIFSEPECKKALPVWQCLFL